MKNIFTREQVEKLREDDKQRVKNSIQKIREKYHLKALDSQTVCDAIEFDLFGVHESAAPVVSRALKELNL